ncbi:MAG: RNA recognition motif domain-containing protein [Fidelibacterota bacterium]
MLLFFNVSGMGNRVLKQISFDNRPQDADFQVGCHGLAIWFEYMTDKQRIRMNIYVGNLPWSTSEEELKALFEGYGSVESARIITDRESGRSKGFGFVEMSDDSEAQKAMEELNGKELSGRALRVNEARPRREENRRF